MKRREFLAGLIAIPVLTKVIVAVKNNFILYGDGKHDDADALQAWFNRESVYYADGTPVGDIISGKTLKLSKPIDCGGGGRGLESAITHCFFIGA